VGLDLGLARASSDYRQKLQELFIWKVSEELKLAPKEEKQFGDLIRELNQRKVELQKDLDQQIEFFKTAKASELKKNLKAYSSSLRRFNEINSDEIEKMKNIIGLEKTAKYLVLKAELSAKLKNMLSEKN
jgi:phage host-nuclease inhibitor protein Gam